MNDHTDRPVKTSLTHPLPLPTVATPGGGMISMTMCPGKRQPEAVTGPWQRDLTLDLKAITEFGARTLISLMEQWELTAANTPVALHEAAKSAGLRWQHWPFADLKAPSAEFEKVWQAEAGDVCRLLHAGERVVIHCRGGRGRSGLVAARLLVELGVGADEAFAAVRAAQPLAIETDVQEKHVRAYKPVLDLR